MAQEPKNFDREMGGFDARLSFVERKVEKTEMDIALMRKENKDGNDKILEKIGELKDQSNFTKGFIRAVIIAGSIVSVLITLAIKYIK